MKIAKKGIYNSGFIQTVISTACKGNLFLENRVVFFEGKKYKVTFDCFRDFAFAYIMDENRVDLDIVCMIDKSDC